VDNKFKRRKLVKISINYLVILLAVILSPAIATERKMFLANWSGSDIHEFEWYGTQSGFASELAASAPAPDNTDNLFKVHLNCSTCELMSYGIHSSELALSGLALDNLGSSFGVDWSRINIYEFSSDEKRSAFFSWFVPSDLVLDVMGTLFKLDFRGNTYEFTPNGTHSTFASGIGLTLWPGLSSIP
jgi:hypothetical protein